MTAEKVLENRLRRIAERRGYRLMKSRRRDPQAIDYGGYMLRQIGVGVVLGAPRYSATLEDIDVFFDAGLIRSVRKAERKRATTRKRS